MIPDELEQRQRRYDLEWRAYAIIRKMRWLTLILGPVPLIWDHIVWPALQKMGVPSIITMEDLMRILILDILPLDRWISIETFERMWPHVVNVCTILFLVFFIWAVQKRRQARAAAHDVAEIENIMMQGGQLE
jgi:hypothetical protein